LKKLFGQIVLTLETFLGCCKGECPLLSLPTSYIVARRHGWSVQFNRGSKCVLGGVLCSMMYFVNTSLPELSWGLVFTREGSWTVKCQVSNSRSTPGATLSERIHKLKGRETSTQKMKLVALIFMAAVVIVTHERATPARLKTQASSPGRRLGGRHTPASGTGSYVVRGGGGAANSPIG
jgi:hypothetical protein